MLTNSIDLKNSLNSVFDELSILSDSQHSNANNNSLLLCPECWNVPNISYDEIERSIISCCDKKIHTKEYSLTEFLKNYSNNKLSTLKCSKCNQTNIYSVLEPINLKFSDLKKLSQISSSSNDAINQFQYCLDCNNFFCPRCEKIHIEETKNHHLFPISKLGNYCVKHNEIYSEYCLNCSENICNECLPLHKTHNIIELKNIFSDEQKIFNKKSQINRLKTELKTIQIIFKEAMDNIVKKFNSLLDKKMEEIQFKENIIFCYEMKPNNYNSANNFNTLIVDYLNFDFKSFFNNNFIDKNNFLDDSIGIQQIPKIYEYFTNYGKICKKSAVPVKKRMKNPSEEKDEVYTNAKKAKNVKKKTNSTMKKLVKDPIFNTINYYGEEGVSPSVKNCNKKDNKKLQIDSEQLLFFDKRVCVKNKSVKTLNVHHNSNTTSKSKGKNVNNKNNNQNLVEVENKRYKIKNRRVNIKNKNNVNKKSNYKNINNDQKENDNIFSNFNLDDKNEKIDNDKKIIDFKNDSLLFKSDLNIYQVEKQNSNENIKSLVKSEENNIKNEKKINISTNTPKIISKIVHNKKEVMNMIKLNDGNFVTSSWDSSVKIFDYKTFKILLVINEREENDVCYVLQLNDESILVCSRKMYKYTLYDNDTRCYLDCVMDQYNDYIIKAIELKNNTIISCDWEYTIKIWEKKSEINSDNENYKLINSDINKGEHLCSICKLNNNEFVTSSNSHLEQGKDVLRFYDENYSNTKSIYDISCSELSDTICQINEKYLAVALQKWNENQIRGIAIIDIFSKTITKNITSDAMTFICGINKEYIISGGRDPNKRSIMRMWKINENGEINQVFEVCTEQKDAITSIVLLDNGNYLSANYDSSIAVLK